MYPSISGGSRDTFNSEFWIRLRSSMGRRCSLIFSSKTRSSESMLVSSARLPHNKVREYSVVGTFAYSCDKVGPSSKDLRARLNLLMILSYPLISSSRDNIARILISPPGLPIGLDRPDTPLMSLFTLVVVLDGSHENQGQSRWQSVADSSCPECGWSWWRGETVDS